MKVIGLTGSFGCGKTTVAKMFQELGAETIDADQIVSQLYKQKSIQQKLQKVFGRHIVSRFGKVKRRKLAKIVFSDKPLLAKLNSLIHPKVLEEIKKKLNELKKEKKEFAVLDVPLLLELKEKIKYDFLVVVTCSKKIQLFRLQKKGFTLDEAFSRIYAQLPIQKKIQAADFVINDSGDLEKTKKQVKKVFAKLSGLK